MPTTTPIGTDQAATPDVELKVPRGLGLRLKLKFERSGGPFDLSAFEEFAFTARNLRDDAEAVYDLSADAIDATDKGNGVVELTLTPAQASGAGYNLVFDVRATDADADFHWWPIEGKLVPVQRVTRGDGSDELAIEVTLEVTETANLDLTTAISSWRYLRSALVEAPSDTESNVDYGGPVDMGGPVEY